MSSTTNETNEMTPNVAEEKDSEYENTGDYSWTFIHNQQEEKIPIMGYGNVPIPSQHNINLLGQDRSISIRCITWNINDKNVKILSKLTEQLSKVSNEQFGDIVCIVLQEIPPSSTRFHEEALKLLNESLPKSHCLFFSNRSWSQMMVMYMNKAHLRYATEPKIKFVASAPIPKPLRTKGGIGVCFRLYQRWIVVIGCHLSHGSMQNRIQDYGKIVKNLKFPNLQQFSGMESVLAADAVIWMGDLNFRVHTDLGLNWKQKEANNPEDIRRVMDFDGLTQSRQKALAFMEFEEGNISFPPTHKYELGSDEYVKDRIPSYTDRVLYYSQNALWISVKDYNTISGPTQSDHRPVYCLLKINVINNPVPQSNRDNAEAIIQQPI
ncbi:unnamed protein product [Auanema sp. JU1783]|nr:unnamed protein product [Auanema sp. JU1783]